MLVILQPKDVRIGEVWTNGRSTWRIDGIDREGITITWLQSINDSITGVTSTHPVIRMPDARLSEVSLVNKILEAYEE